MRLRPNYTILLCKPQQNDSLSLSLSHTHTHTHSLSLSLSLSPSVSLNFFFYPLSTSLLPTHTARNRLQTKHRNNNILYPEMPQLHAISSVPGPKLTRERGQGRWIIKVGDDRLQEADQLADQPHDARVVAEFFL